MKSKLNLQLNGIIVLFILSLNTAIGQGPSWNYAKTGSNAAIQSMKNDSVGNVYMASIFYTSKFEYNNTSVPGLTGSETNNLAIYKTDPAGKPIWMHSVRGTSIGASIDFNNMAINQRGEMIISFRVSNTPAFILDKYSTTTDTTNDNLYVAKFSKSGFLVWIKHIYSEGSSSPVVDLNDMLIDENGTSYLSGGFTGAFIHADAFKFSGLGDLSMMYIIKIENKGDVAWVRGCNYGPGFDGTITAKKIKLSKSGTLYIAGTFSGYQSFKFGSDSTISDMSVNTFLAAYNPSGTALWGKFVFGAISEYPEDIIIADNSDVYLFGYSNSNPVNIMGSSEDNTGSDYDLFIAHISATGIYFNSTLLSTQIPNQPFGKSVFGIGRDNNIILASEFNTSTILSGAATVTNPEPGFSDLVFAKLRPSDLLPLWSAQGSSSGTTDIGAANIDNYGNTCIAGTIYKNLTVKGVTVTGDISNGTPYLIKINNNGSVDYSFQKLNNASNFINVQKTVGDINGNIYITGTFSGPDNLLDDVPMIRPDDNGFFLAKYCYTKNICGSVTDILGNPINDGYVKIYGYTYFQRSPLNDSIMIEPDGRYCINNIPYGSYIICAYPQGDFETAFVPTYYSGEINWENAEKIFINNEVLPPDFKIEVVNRTSLIGASKLTGNLQIADSNNIYKSTSAVSAKPSQRTTVVLAGKKKLKSTTDFYATTLTDEDGNFSFNNVPDGTYYIWIEIPGLPSEEYIVTVEGGVFIGSLDFFADEETVYLAGKPLSYPLSANDNSENWVYPIPAHNELTINLWENEKKASVRIIDLTGKEVYKSDIVENMEIINVSSLSAGYYVIQITTTSLTKSKKINIVP